MTQIAIREVGLRDGLQSIADILPTETKLAWCDAEYDAGMREVEATAMVPARLLPQLADGDRVVAHAKKLAGLTISVLVPNLRGAEHALELGIDKINYVLSASESHNRANVHRSTQESLDDFRRIVERISATEGFRPAIAAGISTAFGCTIEGAIDERRLCTMAEELAKDGASELIVADTVGYANPASVSRVFADLRLALGEDFPLIGHFHDTRGLGLANTLAAIEHGVFAFDVSLGGLGGCPHAPGATGNIATEDLVFMCEAMGLATGFDLEKLLACRDIVAAAVPHVPLPGAIARSGLPKNFRSAT